MKSSEEIGMHDMKFQKDAEFKIQLIRVHRWPKESWKDDHVLDVEEFHFCAVRLKL